MNVSLFSKRKDDMLIDLVRANPILYDSHHDHFRNLIMKHQIWESISKDLDIPLLDVKKRWRHFRDHCLKKRRQYEAGLARGKMWEYMPQLEFLAFSRGRELKGSAADEDAPDADYSSQHTDESDAAEPPADAPAPRKKLKAEPAAAEEPHSSQPVYVECEAKPRLLDDKSPVHKFFDSMADIVAQFPPRLAAETRLRVCQLVTEMEMQLQNEDPILGSSHFNFKVE